jgi:hypothetical protein
MADLTPVFTELFGAVQWQKSCVSFHLMPVYTHLELLVGLSPALKKRMQGKSCFNFTEVDAALFAKLASLTRAGYEHYRAQGFVWPEPRAMCRQRMSAGVADSESAKRPCTGPGVAPSLTSAASDSSAAAIASSAAAS